MKLQNPPRGQSLEERADVRSHGAEGSLLTPSDTGDSMLHGSQ